MNRPNQENSRKNKNPGGHIAKILSMQAPQDQSNGAQSIRRSGHAMLDYGLPPPIQITDRPPSVYHRLPNFHSFLSPASACSTAGFQLPGGRQSGHDPQHSWPHISPFPPCRAAVLPRRRPQPPMQIDPVIAVQQELHTRPDPVCCQRTDHNDGFARRRSDPVGRRSARRDPASRLPGIRQKQ